MTLLFGIAFVNQGCDIFGKKEDKPADDAAGTGAAAASSTTETAASSTTETAASSTTETAAGADAPDADASTETTAADAATTEETEAASSSLLEQGVKVGDLKNDGKSAVVREEPEVRKNA